MTAPNPISRRRRHAALIACMIAVSFPGESTAADVESGMPVAERRIEELLLRIAAVERESQRELAALRQRTDKELRQLRSQIAALQAASGEVTLADRDAATVPLPVSAGNVSDKLAINGDFRLRFENNSSVGAQPSYSRGVLRGRLGAAYSLNDSFEIGGRLVTGDPDNPRTADITLSGFSSDFEISLDQAYATFHNGGLMLTGGKFVKPFSSTELVWDGDVNPQGVSGYFDRSLSESLSARVSAVYFLIDENIVEGDSKMRGAQVSASWRPGPTWKIDLHGGYFDYELGTLAPDMQALARGNVVAPGGVSLLSDFDLLDVIGSATYSGFRDRWPVRLVGNHVRNLGAVGTEDKGYGLDLYAGRLKRPGDLILQYGYAQTETDAVLGLFSHDNIAFPTNYKQHTLSAVYKLMEHTFLGLTHYHYRRLKPDEAAMDDNDWITRTRLNLWFSF